MPPLHTQPSSPTDLLCQRISRHESSQLSPPRVSHGSHMHHPTRTLHCRKFSRSIGRKIDMTHKPTQIVYLLI